MLPSNVAPAPPCAREDAIQLFNAFKTGLGCEYVVISILADRGAMQRANIQQEYRTIYSESLSERLSSVLDGKLQTAALMWMPQPAERDAIILMLSLTSTKILETATEVICSRTPSELQCIKDIYYSKYGVGLEQVIEGNTSGYHKKILLQYVTKLALRDEDIVANEEMAVQDAKLLYEEGKKKKGTADMTFVQIFSERSAAHLAVVSNYYRRMSGHSLKKAVKNITPGNFALALRTIVQCAENRAKYFAKVIHMAMECKWSGSPKLTRVIVTRAEIDMQYISAEYFRKYDKRLEDEVYAKTSPPCYRDFLLSLIGARD